MARRNLVFTPESWADYTYWINQDKKTLKKINKLIADTLRSPFEGLGKPEPLKENYAGLWSRRIDDKIDLFMKLPILPLASSVVDSTIKCT